MIVTGVDFETTGLDPKNDRVVEIGAILWDTNGGVPLKLQSDLVFDGDIKISEENQKAHGITLEALQRYGVPPANAFVKLSQMIDMSEAVVAHNGSIFDHPFYDAETKRHKVVDIDRTWIDTTIDLAYPEELKTRRLTHLAADHGFLNPFAHRAVFDVMTMLMIFQKYDPQRALWYAQQPFVILRAVVSYDDRQLAKDRGFRWHPDLREWRKTVRLPDVDSERHEAGFKVVIEDDAD